MFPQPQRRVRGKNCLFNYRLQKPIEKLKSKAYFPLEDIDENQVENRKLVIVPREEGETKS
jgi:hypothetical protein